MLPYKQKHLPRTVMGIGVPFYHSWAILFLGFLIITAVLHNTDLNNIMIDTQQVFINDYFING